MITMLQAWKGPVEVNGQRYDSVAALTTGNNVFSGKISIKLYADAETAPVGGIRRGVDGVKNGEKEVDKQKFRVTVKQYMTKPSEPGFDFMAKWNNDKPMPMRTMTGTVLKETRGMVQMQLKGFGEATCNCLRCGKVLNNPISKYYGIGPDCMAKLGLTRDIDDVEGIKKDLQEIEWTGWIIKSAITEWEEIDEHIK